MSWLQKSGKSDWKLWKVWHFNIPEEWAECQQMCEKMMSWTHNEKKSKSEFEINFRWIKWVKLSVILTCTYGQKDSDMKISNLSQLILV